MKLTGLFRRPSQISTEQDVRAVNLLKGFAILAVVILHVFSSYPGFYAGMSTVLSHIALDQLLRFCVPIFVGISGYALYRRYESGLSLPTYLKKRVMRLLPQYLLWSLIFIFVMPRLYPAWGNPSFGVPFLTTLLLGKADYHLYFVPLIVQLYLLFPILRLGMKKKPVFTLAVMGLMQLGALFLLSPWVLGKYIAPESIQDQNHYDFSFFWIFFFGLGMWIARKAPSRHLILKGLSLGALAFVGYLVMVRNAAQAISGGLSTITALRFTRFSVALYSSGFIGFALLAKQGILKVLGRLSWPFEKLGEQSFLIFLSHTFLLRAVVAYVFGGASMHSLVPAGLVFAAGIWVSFMIQ